MLPRLVFGSILLAILLSVGYGVSRMIVGNRPLPRAVALLEAKNPTAAQPILRQLVRAEPRNAEAHVLLAKTQLDLNDPVAAEKELKIARVLQYEKAVLNPLLARSYLMQGHYDDVLTDMPETVARQDELFPNLVARGQAYLGLGDLESAQASFDAAARLRPNDLQILISRARVALATGDIGLASRLADEAMGRMPEDLAVLLLQSDVLARRGAVGEALAMMDKVIAAAPFSVPARLQRADQLMQLNRDPEARADVDAVLKLETRNPQALVTHAVLTMRSGRLADAMTEFQKLAPLMDQAPRAYLYQAQTAAAMGQNATGLDTVLRYLKLVPSDVEGLRLAATLALKLDQPTRAVTVLTQGIAGGLNDAPSFDLLGRAYFVEGLMAEAVANYRRASALEPGNAEYAAHLAAAAQFTRSGPVERPGTSDRSGQAAGSRD